MVPTEKVEVEPEQDSPQNPRVSASPAPEENRQEISLEEALEIVKDVAAKLPH